MDRPGWAAFDDSPANFNCGAGDQPLPRSRRNSWVSKALELRCPIRVCKRGSFNFP